MNGFVYIVISNIQVLFYGEDCVIRIVIEIIVEAGQTYICEDSLKDRTR